MSRPPVIFQDQQPPQRIVVDDDAGWIRERDLTDREQRMLKTLFLRGREWQQFHDSYSAEIETLSNRGLIDARADRKIRLSAEGYRLAKMTERLKTATGG